MPVPPDRPDVHKSVLPSVHHVNRLTILVRNDLAGGRVERAIARAQEAGIRVPAGTDTGTTFVCPYHGARLAAPCGITSCRYHVPFEAAQSCVLAYCHDHQAGQLSIPEIAFLYDEPVATVQRHADAAVVAVRASSMDADARNDQQYCRTFWQVESPDVCCACGSRTDGARLPVAGSPLAWCSPECRDDLPADVATLEWRFGRTLAAVLAWAVRRYREPAVMAPALGLTVDRLAQLAARHGIRVALR